MTERDAAWMEKRLRYLLSTEPSDAEAYAKFEKEFPSKAKDKAPKEKGKKSG